MELDAAGIHGAASDDCLRVQGTVRVGRPHVPRPGVLSALGPQRTGAWQVEGADRRRGALARPANQRRRCGGVGKAVEEFPGT